LDHLVYLREERFEPLVALGNVEVLLQEGAVAEAIRECNCILITLVRVLASFWLQRA
jgi:hypothetical protein